jgi:hypothetical protein
MLVRMGVKYANEERKAVNRTQDCYLSKDSLISSYIKIMEVSLDYIVPLIVSL